MIYKIIKLLKKSIEKIGDHLLLSFLVAFIDFIAISIILYLIPIFLVSISLIHLGIAYLSWTILQSIAWHITYRISEKKEGPKLRNYIKRFSIVTLIGFSAIIIALLSIEYDFIFIGILSITLIIMHIYYCFIFKKNSINDYIKDAKLIFKTKNLVSILILLLFVSVAMIISYLVQYAFTPFPEAVSIVGFLLFFGIIIITRLTLINLVEKF